MVNMAAQNNGQQAYIFLALKDTQKLDRIAISHRLERLTSGTPTEH